MTKVHQGLGLHCTYPENWQLTEDTEEGATLGFTVQSPNTAFMSVLEYPGDVSPSQVIEQVKEAFAAEYDDVEYEAMEPELPGVDAPLEDLCVGTLNFYYLDLIATARLVAFRRPQGTMLIQFQAEDREFADLERVFHAMLISMFPPERKKPHPT
jgi:hypothetical protein